MLNIKSNSKNLLVLLLTLTLSLSFTACSPHAPQQPPTDETVSSPPTKDNNTIVGATPLSSDTLINDLKAKYSAEEQYRFADEIYVLERNEILEIDLGFAINSQHNTYDMFQFFLDPELTIPLWRPAPADYYMGHDKIKIKPKTYPLFRTEFEGESKRRDANWGNAGTLYLAKYYDSEGNVSKEPQEISIVKIKTELPRPEVTLITDEYGFATLTWAPVKGATEYSVYSIQIDNNQISDDEILYYCGSTADTYFNDFSLYLHDTSDISGVETNNILSINDDFVHNEDGYGKGYVVIAESSIGKSEMSRLIAPNDYSHMLPHIQDFDASMTEVAADDELKLPLYLPIEMCNETTVLFPIEYNIDSAEKFTGASATAQVEGKGLAQRMTIIGRPKGTPFEEVFYFYYFPERESIESALNRFLKRQEQLTINAAGLNNNMTLETVSDDTDLPSDSNSISLSINDELPVTATNPLSEYLAHNMLSGVSSISLKDFPQASDTNYLSDALFETIYQNPLIFGIDSATVNPYTNSLVVTYTLDRATQKEHQQLVLREAKAIVGAIITTDMTDLEKEEAINAYLCENLVYDSAALESGKKNDYKYADPEFDDSFTVYGALINKVCVCKGYAEAFKLLADLSGLDTLVVSGQIESIGHAWNKVKIEDEWLTLDVTNNDNDIIPNALFNLPDTVASMMLIEDKNYILDANYNNYKGTSTDSEYYHLKNNYFSKDELPQILTSKLSSSFDEITLRTDFDITDNELYEILDYAASNSSANVAFNYMNWLGVIYIKTS